MKLRNVLAGLVMLVALVGIFGVGIYGAHAQGTTGPGISPVDIPSPGNAPITQTGQAIDLVRYVLRLFGIIFWIAAVGFILYAGFLYLTAGGEPEKVGKANRQLLYAIVAIAVGLLAFGVPTLVQSFLKQQ